MAAPCMDNLSNFSSVSLSYLVEVTLFLLSQSFVLLWVFAWKLSRLLIIQQCWQFPLPHSSLKQLRAERPQGKGPSKLTSKLTKCTSNPSSCFCTKYLTYWKGRLSDSHIVQWEGIRQWGEVLKGMGKFPKPTGLSQCRYYFYYYC